MLFLFNKIKKLFFFACIGLFFVAQAQHFQPRVVDGNDTTPEKYPSFVVLLIETIEGQSICGGTLISKQWLMTAAHCADNLRTSEIKVGLKPTQYTTSEGIIASQWITVESIKIHPGYVFPESGYPQNDIALIKLTEPVNQPVAILNDINSVIKKDNWAIIVGLGTTKRLGRYENIPTPSSTLLQEAKLPLVDPNCSYTVLCAGYDDRQYHPDGCMGDSGGPLYTYVLQKKVQIGITSGGIGCGIGYAGAYTNVKTLKSYIKETVSDAVFLSELLPLIDSFE